MAEYIKRKELLEFLCKQRNENDLLDDFDDGIVFGLDVALTAIEDAPAADVAPVVRGQWIPFHSQVAGYIQYCSACSIGCTWQPNYCPYCGAKMDKEH